MTSHGSAQAECRGIAICIATRDRPHGARRLVCSLDRLDCPPVPVRIILVDNSSVGFPDYASALRSARFGMTVLRERRIGIPFARNAALDVVHDDEWAAFIDDDEAATPGWLREMYDVMKRYRCDAVGGPVHTVFPDGLRHWTIDCGAFRRREVATGSLCDSAATNNALVRVSTIRRHGLRFDVRFPLLGDDDSWFFRSLVRHVGTIRWAAEASVYEFSPASRATLPWLVRRAFATGYGPTARRLRNSPTGGTWLREMMRSVCQMSDGLRLLALGVVHGRTELLRGGRRFVVAVGIVWALFGLGFFPYRFVDGTVVEKSSHPLAGGPDGAMSFDSSLRQ
jgi:glycosyltransferase involved in cell wall biosynthesis